MTPAALAALIRPHLRPGIATERELQDQIERILAGAGIAYERERALSKRDRPDFLVGGTALEVKIGGTGAALLQQVIRYLEHDTVTGVLAISTRTQHRLPAEAMGKPVVLIHLTVFGAF